MALNDKSNNNQVIQNVSEELPVLKGNSSYQPISALPINSKNEVVEEITDLKNILDKNVELGYLQVPKMELIDGVIKDVIEAKDKGQDSVINLLVKATKETNNSIDQLKKLKKIEPILASASDDLSFLGEEREANIIEEAQPKFPDDKDDELFTVESEEEFMRSLEENRKSGDDCLPKNCDDEFTEVVLDDEDAKLETFSDVVETLLDDAPVELERELDEDGKGPQTPEFSSFESVSTDKMVNPYTGDLTYSLPILEVPGAHNGGYAVALAYHSGSGPNDDASWVGHGWNLSPGAINRIKKGFPDDIQNEPVEYINDTRPNQTIALSPGLGIEAFSINLNFSKIYTYNNYKGFGGGYSMGLTAFGAVGASWTMEDGKGSFSPIVNPFALLGQFGKRKKSTNSSQTARKKGASVSGFSLKQSMGMAQSKLGGAVMSYGMSLLSDGGGALNVTEFTGSSETVDLGIVGDIPTIAIGISGNIKATKTIQNPVRFKTRRAFGYLYSDRTYQSLNNAENTSNNDIMDYHIEKNGNYSKRDNYLPVPFSDVDIYNVSGEGISGGFRAFWSKPTMVFPPGAKSITQHRYNHIQGHIGTTIGLGWSNDAGTTVTKSSHNWADNGVTNDFKTKIEPQVYPGTTKVIPEDEPFHFRFFSDLGGSTILDNSFTSLAMSVSPSIGSGNVSNYQQKSGNTLEGKGRVGRSTFIDFHTNEYINSNVNSNNPMRTFEGAYSGSSAVYSNYINRADASIAKHIGEFSLTNPDGTNFVYGLPVYNKNEQSISYNISADKIISQTPSTPFNYQIKYNLPITHSKVGEKHNYSYPAYYLLTSIRSRDYEDINNNFLLDEEDFGGYTQFSYNRIFGSANKNSGSWYNWRVPFSGLNLDQNRLNLNYDNFGSFNRGEKELYNVKTIETKTHIAVFVTNKSNGYTYKGINLPNTQGSGDDRLDGMSAVNNEFAAAAGDISSAGLMMPEYLEKVILFAKPIGKINPTVSDYKVLKTVRFSYDYSIWPNSPGVRQTAVCPNAGKLTLKRVWVENENVKNAKVSPYKFEYTYSTAQTPYPTKYANLATFYNGKKQDPDYVQDAGNCVDRWGDYMDNGFFNRSQLKAVTPQNPSVSFDPSAWQLKQIKVPTGSVIQLQYEQDDYAYVQNKKANIMMPMTSGSDDGDNIYIIDLQALYPGITVAQCSTFVQKLNNYYNSNNPYIYFKFLYKLANPPGTPISNLPLSSNDCSTEYITGYVKFGEAKWIGNKLQIVLVAPSSPNPPSSTSLTFPTNNYKYPKNVCFDYFKTETGYQSGSCGTKLDMNNGAAAIALKFINRFNTQLSNFLGNSTICTSIVPELSYFRLPIEPMFMVKKGGGIRVKRLLRYDKGLQVSGDDKALYGVEYTYRGNDNSPLTSGVATNEPQEAREENVLVDFIEKRQSQKWYQKALAGVDKEQFEGPYGESALPPASVGYSMIQVKNIHTGKTDDGINVFEYYTAADYPFDGSFSGGKFFGNSKKKQYDKIKLFIGFFRHEIRNIHKAAQGYHQVIYNIAGKPKSEAKYLGNDLNNNIYKKIYSYYQPSEKLPLQTEVISNISELQYLGVDQEIVTERKRTIEKHESKQYNIDLAFGIPYGWPSGGFMIWKTENNTEISTLVNNKTTYLPVVLKSVTEIKNGLKNRSDNITYNKYSGSAVVVKTFDDFNSKNNTANIPAEYYGFSQPAYMHYPNYNQKAFNQNKNILESGIIVPNGNLTFNNGVEHIVVGDLLELYDASGNVIDYYYIKERISTTSYVSEKYDGTITASVPFVYCKVIKSGYNNNTDEIVGNMTTYGPLPNNFSAPITSASLTSLFVNSGFTTNSGVAINMGTWGYYDYATNTNINVPAAQCNSINMIYESYIPPGSNDLYLVKYCPSNCFISVTNPPNINSTPLALNSNYVNLSSVTPNTSLPHGILAYKYLGKTGGTLNITYNPTVIPTGEPGCSWQLDYADSLIPGTPVVTNSFGENIWSCDKILSNVLSLQGKKFAHDWDYSDLNEYKNLSGIALTNSFSQNKLGNWRTRESYAYKKDRNIDYNNSTARNYNSGMFEFMYHDWDSFGSDPSWTLSSTVKNYSPHGEAIEEEDAIGIYSSIKYTVNNTMPGVVVDNAEHNSVFFESFEDYNDVATIQAKYNGNYSYTPGYSTDINFTTSGKNVLELTSNGNIEIPFSHTKDYDNKDILVKYWSSTYPSYGESAHSLQNPVPNNSGCSVEFLTGAAITTTYSPIKLATVGPWCLFEVRIPTFPYSASSTNVYKLKLKGKGMFVDDIRYQPVESSMKAYVYDANKKRLLVELNDEHMPIKYIYNLEGKLIRRVIWTERGVKTIEEKQYNKAFKTNKTSIIIK